MGFYLRKSLRVGPIRFNLSKSGIGVSTGIKGFRVGTGPRGNYVHMGRGGLYYRQTLPASPSGKPAEFRPQPQSADEITEIESGDVSQMTDASAVSLLEELNRKQKRVSRWPFGAIVAFGIVYSFGIASGLGNVDPLLLAAVVAACAVSVWLLYRNDVLARTTVRFYELESDMEDRYQALHNAHETLTRCGRLRHVAGQGTTNESEAPRRRSDTAARNDDSNSHAAARSRQDERLRSRNTRWTPDYVLFS